MMRRHAKTQVTAEDLARLPARFRAHIAQLEYRVREFEETKAAQTPTRLIVEPYSAKVFLYERSTIRFQTDEHRYIDFTLRSHKFESGYNPVGPCCVGVNSSHTLIVTPAAGNMLYLETER